MSKEQSENDQLLIHGIEEEKGKKLAQIKDANTNVQECMGAGKFKEAENEIVKILKPVLSRPESKSLYIDVKVATEALSALYNLGQIYLQSNCDNNHVKAAAIFQYCARFSNKYNAKIELSDSVLGDGEYFINQAYLVERNFLVSQKITEIKEAPDYIEDSADKLGLYKNELVAIREYTKEKLEDIESLGIDQIGIRTTKVRDIYEDCTSFFVCAKKEQLEGKKEEVWQRGLVQRLIAESIEQLGSPPEGCEYSIIGLGSLAFGTMTPWSDLEFAVLIKDAAGKKREDEYREYFRNLTKLLWIKVINLGETPLSAVGVEALNDYKTGKPEDNWFVDNITEKAFRFDPVYQDACKSALGRQGNYVVNGKPVENYELIKTPQEMMEFQAASNKDWFAIDKHLVQALQTVTLIYGTGSILDDYKQKLSDFRAMAENEKLMQDRALTLLKEDVNKFLLRCGKEDDGKLFNIKTTIYRLGDRIINDLDNYYNITAKEGKVLTVWDIIDKMQEQGLLTEKGAENLTQAISISTGLRLSTYSANKGRNDSMSTYRPVITQDMAQEEKEELTNKTFHFKDINILHHFYHVMMATQNIIWNFCTFNAQREQGKLNLTSDLYAGDPHVKGLIHKRLLNYSEAIKCFEQELENPKDFSVKWHTLLDLQDIYRLTEQPKEHLEISERLIDAYEEYFSKDEKASLEMQDVLAGCYNNLASALYDKGNYSNAEDYCHKAIKIRCDNGWFYHSSNGVSYTHLGNIYMKNKKFNEAQLYYSMSLEIGKHHQDIKAEAGSYNSLAYYYKSQKNYEDEEKCLQKVLELYRQFYKDTPNHPKIADVKLNIGGIYKAKIEELLKKDLSDKEVQKQILDYCDKAIDNDTDALGMFQIFFGTIPDNMAVADAYHNRSIIFKAKMSVYNMIDDKKNAEMYYWAALYDSAMSIKIKKKVLADNNDQSSLAASISNWALIEASVNNQNHAIVWWKIALDRLENSSGSHLEKKSEILMFLAIGLKHMAFNNNLPLDYRIMEFTALPKSSFQGMVMHEYKPEHFMDSIEYCKKLLDILSGSYSQNKKQIKELIDHFSSGSGDKEQDLALFRCYFNVKQHIKKALKAKGNESLKEQKHELAQQYYKWLQDFTSEYGMPLNKEELHQPAQIEHAGESGTLADEVQLQ